MEGGLTLACIWPITGMEGRPAHLLDEILMGALLESIASITEGGWTILDWLHLNIHQQSLLVAGVEIMPFLAT